jgi:nitrogen fixation protein NifX
MKIAFTSSDGRTVDQHFGQATRFWIWEVGPGLAEPIGEVAIGPTGADEEDRITARATAIAGCAVVYTQQIGGPAAAKLVARRIHPMKTQAEVPVTELVEKLQEVLRGRPPPWLRRLIEPAPAEAGNPLR